MTDLQEFVGLASVLSKDSRGSLSVANTVKLSQLINLECKPLSSLFKDDVFEGRLSGYAVLYDNGHAFAYIPNGKCDKDK